MTTRSGKPDASPADAPQIPSPPSQEDIDQVSRDQALIADEWAPNTPDAPPGPANASD